MKNKKIKLIIIVSVIIISFSIGFLLISNAKAVQTGYNCCAIYAHDCQCLFSCYYGCDCTIPCEFGTNCTGPSGQVCCLCWNGQ